MVSNRYIKAGNGGGEVSLSTAMLMQTGQTTSYSVDDDGDIQYGRSFFSLSSENPFGNTYRFTGITGGYFDGTDYRNIDGEIVIKSVAFPDNLLCDWSTKTILGNFLMYIASGSVTGSSWENVKSNINSISVSGFEGFVLTNRTQLLNIVCHGTTTALEYKPFELTDSELIWTSTTMHRDSIYAYRLQNQNGSMDFGNKTEFYTYVGIAVRETNISELDI